MNLKSLLVSSCIVFAGTLLSAQDYNAIGGRIDNEFGVTYLHRFKKNTVIEGIAMIQSHAVVVNALYEKYHSITRKGNLQYYYGGGAFVGFGGGSSAAGVRGILGLCYVFNDIPFVISADWFPALQLVKNVEGTFDIIGLSIRYTF
jgi:hypothetical protein